MSLLCKGSRSQVAEAAVRTTMIVLLAPVLDDNLCFMPVGKDPAIQTFAAKRAVETLDEGILPGTARRNVHGVAVTVTQPLLKGVGDELWPLSLRK